MKDIDVLEFARRISMLPIKTPLSMNYDRIYGQKSDRWWSSQREHLTVWCLHYPTGGVPGYEHTPSNSAKTMYNHFGRPETLLWLAEALGEDDRVLNNVINTIKDIENPRSACAELRRQIPFSRILELMNIE